MSTSICQTLKVSRILTININLLIKESGDAVDTVHKEVCDFDSFSDITNVNYLKVVDMYYLRFKV